MPGRRNSRTAPASPSCEGRPRIPPFLHRLSSSPSGRRPSGRELPLAAFLFCGVMMSTATAPMPPAMTASMDSLARRRPTPPPATRSAPPWHDWLFERTTMCFALFVLCTLVGIIGSLALAAVSAFEKFGVGFFFTNVWDPVKLNFGALAPIFGTLVTSAIALLIGVPVSFGIALFLTEMCPVVLKRPLGTAVELLAAIPSIIYGMWGLFVFAPFFADYIQPLLTRVFGPIWLI